jgi:homoserine dehydrogenase
MLKVCIVGLGQMGGSLGLALKKNSRSLKNCYRITGIGRRIVSVKVMDMDITEKIKGIKYKKALEKNLIKFNLENFDINSSPSSSLIFDRQKLFTISKWVSPKRTRSYP